MKQESPIHFALADIRTKEFAAFPENFTNDKAVEIGTGVSFTVDNLENNILLTDLTVDCSIQEKNFLKIRVLFYYRIEKQSWENLKKENVLIFPKNLVTHLSLLSLGTLRGILFEKIHTDETSLSKYILPLINISDLINEDVKIIVA